MSFHLAVQDLNKNMDKVFQEIKDHHTIEFMGVYARIGEIMPVNLVKHSVTGEVALLIRYVESTEELHFVECHGGPEVNHSKTRFYPAQESLALYRQSGDLVFPEVCGTKDIKVLFGAEYFNCGV